MVHLTFIWLVVMQCSPSLKVHPLSEDPCNLDAFVRRYNTALSKVIDCHAPLTTKTVKNRPAVPWYNDEIKAAKRLTCKTELENL